MSFHLAQTPTLSSVSKTFNSIGFICVDFIVPKVGLPHLVHNLLISGCSHYHCGNAYSSAITMFFTKSLLNPRKKEINRINTSGVSIISI